MGHKPNKIIDAARAQERLRKALARDAAHWRQHEAQSASKISPNPVISFPDERPSSRRDSEHMFNIPYSVSPRGQR